MDVEAMWVLAKPIVAGQARHLMSVAGGVLIGAGALSKGDEASFIQIGTGIVMWAIPAGWSWWQKEGQTKLLAFMAKSKPVALSTATTSQAVKAAQAAAKVAAVLLVALMLSAVLMPSSFAATKAKAKAAPAATTIPLTNPLQSFLDQINQKVSAINALTLTDAQAAMQMAANDPVGLACYTAVANKLQAAQTAGGSLVPKSLGVLQLIETARLAKLQISGIQNGTDPVVAGCAPLILDVNTTLLMLAGQGVVGAAGASVGLPVLPGL